MKLIDAAYIISLARSRDAIMPRRQDLPPAAFVPLSAMHRWSRARGGCLNVVVVSHAWLQPDHPDPKGDNLRLLGRALELWLEGSRTMSLQGGPGGAGCNFIGVFLDYMSLHQKATDGGAGAGGLAARSGAEEVLFDRALSSMSAWYAHPRTAVFKVRSHA